MTLLLLLLAATALASRVELGNNRIVRIFGPLSIQDHVLLATMDMWGVNEQGGMEIRVSPEEFTSLLHLNMTDVTVEHVKHLSWLHDPANNQVCMNTGEECARADDFYTKYQRKAAIDGRLASLTSQFPTLMAAQTWGKTYSGQIQQGVRITSDVATPSNKKIMFFFCGEHAREWIPPMFCTYLAENLVTQYATNNNIKALVDKFEFHILPLMNPDGSEYSFTTDPMWRKNRQPNSNSACIGTDCNRNYPFFWNSSSQSSNPCTETYRGPQPGSAVETSNIFKYVAENAARLGFIADIHAYGNMYMHPWGYTNALSKDDVVQQKCGKAAGDAIRAVHGQVFRTGSIANVIYIAAGSSVDQFYGVDNVIFSYAAEVRGNSFQPPASNIMPSNEELWAGFLAGVTCATTA
jgi:carboxypeptidase A2